MTMDDLNKGFSETTSKPREQSCLPFDLMSSRGTRHNTAGARDKFHLKTTSVQIPVDLIKTLSQPATRNAANRADIDRRQDLEAADHSNDVSGSTSPTFTGDDSSSSSEDTDNDDSPGKNVLHFSHNDPTNPYCFSTLRKTAIVLTGMLIVINSAMGSSISSGISSEMTDYFGITSKSQLVLPTCIYLVGYYIVDAYEIFSASAMAAASCSRSMFAVALPSATAPMYERLGIA